MIPMKSTARLLGSPLKRIKQIDRGCRDWYQLNCHRKRAKYQLMIEPLCRFCQQAGRVEPARIADHVVPHRGDWNLFRLGDLQSLCDHCHNAIKRRIEDNGESENYSRAIGLDGFPTDARHPLYRRRHQARPRPPR